MEQNKSEEFEFLKNENIKTFFYDSLPSTNLTAKELIRNGTSEDFIVIANEQTAGRGRKGRDFFSPGNTGIYMSLAICAKKLPKELTLITTYTSVVICYAIEKLFNLKPKIKWVNDIYLNDKKICGILTEAVTGSKSTEITHIIIGVGINLTTEIFPDEIKDIAGSLFFQNGGAEVEIPEDFWTDDIRPYTDENLSTQHIHDIKNVLINEIIKEFHVNFDTLRNGGFIDDYKERSNVIGKDITYFEGEAVNKAKVLDIDNSGGLIVCDEDGNEITLSSGEISIWVREKGDFANASYAQKKHKTKDLIFIAMFATLTAIFSQIFIPLPFTPIPINLATLSVFLAGGLLGSVRGALSQIVYVLLGAFGVPVFVGFVGGVGILAGPTGGYILGYVIAAFVIGIVYKYLSKRVWGYFASMTCGILCIYFFGTLWFMQLTNIGLFVALTMCVFPYILGDVLKMVLAAFLVKRLKKIEFL